MPTSIPLRNEKARDDSSRAPQDDLRSDPYVRGKETTVNAMRVADADATTTSTTTKRARKKTMRSATTADLSTGRPEDAQQQENDAWSATRKDTLRLCALASDEDESKRKRLMKFIRILTV